MAISRVETESTTLWSQAVRLRDRYCQICGRPDTEAHHIVFKSQGDWEVQFDSDFGAALCAQHHRGSPQARNAPHANVTIFDAELLPKILARMDPERAHRITEYMALPWSAPAGYPNFPGIRAKLKKEVKQLERDFYMDADCEPA